MDATKFHVLREAIRRQAPPPPAEELPGLSQFYRRQLAESSLFDDLEVTISDDVDELITATCYFTEDWTADQIADELERLWANGMRHPFWEAHSIHTEPGEVALEAATRFGKDGPYLTLRVVAQQTPIPRQRQPLTTF